MPPHSVPWVPSDAAPESQEHEPPVKSVAIVPSVPSESDPTKQRPWSNTEQEALYVAVQRYNLFGRWADVKDRMHLDRSIAEIEQEYMRLYGELPDSDDDDDDDWPEHDPIVASRRRNAPGHVTPALTSTSSTSLSARSSLETFSSHFHRSLNTTSELPHHPPPPYSKYSAANALEDDHDDDESMETEMPSPSSRTKGSTAQSRSSSSSTANAVPDSKPARTVRVWTQQQSQQLKNLIEDCFPGGYRINWVWVASQMGNTFTRKQCKNKWEIMRRRAGTEEEINLLKKGHEEFGPSWSKIQEKYLPERSQGGISIMWSLLQAREAEQKQQAEKAHRADPRSDYDSTRPRHETRTTPTTAAAAATATAPDVRRKTSPHEGGGGPLRRKSAERDRPYRPRVNTHPNMPDGSPDDRDHMDRHPTDYHSYESNSRDTSLSPVWRREGLNAVSPSSYSVSTFRDAPHAKRFSISSTDSYSGQQDRHLNPHHQQQQHYYPQSSSYQHPPHHRQHSADTAPELWSERNRPMTWTEPLTRRLEDIIHQHFPNHQKVNWVKVSALMGSNPVVTKEQCKRRWYLMSQYEHLRSRPIESSSSHDPNAHDMAMDMDMPADSRQDSHSPSSPVTNSGSPLQKRSLEYVPWTEQEVDLLKRGVEQFGRSWTEIQQAYLKDRSVSSMASKWDYLMRMKTPSRHPGQHPSAINHRSSSSCHVSPGADYSRDMEDDQTSDLAI
ncbi:hypothetical protein BGX31_000148 [Mortierella sp. GBA43]|nr:hypothetical protein BGX31_000148 [Mortierella sp. GBA43]